MGRHAILIFFALSILAAIILAGCSSNNPNVNPELYSPVFPETLYRNSGSFYIEVRVRDPQGLDDISSVEYSLYFPSSGDVVINWSRMFDSGAGGDSVAGDGRYAAIVRGLSLSDSSGDYNIRFRASDKSNHASNTLDESIVVPGNNIPAVTIIAIPDTIYSDETDSSLFIVQVSDPDGNGQISKVWFNLYNPDGAAVDSDSYMYDDGINGGDSTAGDYKFSFRLASFEFEGILGNYRIEFHATDTLGAPSRTVSRTFHVTVLNNEPPMLSNLIAPDTLSSSSPDTSRLYLDVSDPQGLRDIDSVWFQSYRPDGSTSGTHYYLVDDGTGEDMVAGDGTYSQGILSYGASPLGLWRFEFRARDVHGALSDPIDKFIQIIQ